MRALLLLPVSSLVLLTLVCGCPKAGTDPNVATATAAPSPPAWMSVKDGKVHDGLAEAPAGIYSPGELKDGRFTPGGDLEGNGPFGAEGTAGFLELSTGQFVPKDKGPPAPPYVEGRMTASDGFAPSSKKVVY